MIWESRSRNDREAYRNRDQPGVVEAFMESEREKAKNTPKMLRF